MRWTCISVAVIAVTLGLVHDAAAQRGGRSYVELVGGMAKPLGEDDYENLVDTSPKLGVRFGQLGGGRGSRVGLELGLDWTPANNDLDDLPAIEAKVNRLRALVGARIVLPVDRGTALFVRGGVGIDYVTAELTGRIGTVSATVDGDSLGIALEVGAGVVFSVSRTAYLGVQVAIPIAKHNDEPDSNEDILVLDYTGYDLDGLVTFGTRF